MTKIFAIRWIPARVITPTGLNVPREKVYINIQHEELWRNIRYIMNTFFLNMVTHSFFHYCNHKIFKFICLRFDNEIRVH
jgi:hypothetical protein